MLKEITDLAQTSDDLHRRWFADDNLDLYLWQNANGVITEFQISYHLNGEDLVLTWNSSSGLTNHKVDSGSYYPAKMKASPILTEESEANVEYVRNVFEKTGQKLEHDVYEFIVTKLNG